MIFKAFRKQRVNSYNIDLNSFLQYCKKLFNSEDIPKLENTNLEHSYENEILLCNITQKEVETQLIKLKSKGKCKSGFSSNNIRCLRNEIAPILTKLFNNTLQNTDCMLKAWIESSVFLIHKKGDRNKPENYRTIFVQNPLLKSFLSVMSKRISEYCENEGLFPDLQFGFRKK